MSIPFLIPLGPGSAEQCSRSPLAAPILRPFSGVSGVSRAFGCAFQISGVFRGVSRGSRGFRGVSWGFRGFREFQGVSGVAEG